MPQLIKFCINNRYVVIIIHTTAIVILIYCIGVILNNIALSHKLFNERVCFDHLLQPLVCISTPRKVSNLGCLHIYIQEFMRKYRSIMKMIEKMLLKREVH